MTFIGGDFKVIEPAKTVVATPEQEAAAAAKLERARAARGKRKADQAAGVTIEPVVIEATGDAPEPYESVTQANAPERQRKPWQSQGERQRVDLNEPEDGPRLPDESKWPTHPETGMRISPKHYARLMQDAKEAEATERGDVQHSRKGAYLNALTNDDDYQAATAAYENADRHLKALESEFDYESYSRRVQAAIAVSDVATINALKVRRRELPDLVYQARYARAQAGLTLSQMKAARARVAKGEARAAANNALAELRALEAKTREIQYAVTDAETHYADATAEVGQWHRQLDALNDEALTQALGSDAHLRHRAPVGMQQEGADFTYQRPMPQPGLPIEQP